MLSSVFVGDVGLDAGTVLKRLNAVKTLTGPLPRWAVLGSNQ
jgi:hypothetical protein